MKRKLKYAGFTLLEILIALFVFTLVSIILTGALRHVLDAQAETEKNAARLRQLQFALLILSHDLEQTVDYPIENTVANGQSQTESALMGSSRGFTFTHFGFVQFFGQRAINNLQRTSYIWWRGSFLRLILPISAQPIDAEENAHQLFDDAANDVGNYTDLAHARLLLKNVYSVHFQYLDRDGRFQDHWPVKEAVGQSNTQSLPKAIRLSLTISHWGTITQLYVIPAQASENPQSES